MSAGWGKKAATRIDRTQFNTDELLKSLGSQFNVDFSNYDQWKRTSRSNKSALNDSSVADSSFTVGRLKSADSTCRHSHRERREDKIKEELEREVSERAKILELRISTRKKTCLEYENRNKELLNENIRLKELIDADESATGEKVKSLLRKYENYRSGIKALNSNFSRELEEVHEELEIAKCKIKSNLEKLQAEVDAVHERLEEKQKEFQVLISYKDKEYPVKALKIDSLKTEINNLKLSNQEDKEELEHIVETEFNKYKKEKIKISNEVTRNVTEKTVEMMHQSLKDMALQNIIMKKEIEFHVQELSRLQDTSAELETEVKKLVLDNKTNIKQHLFPEFFQGRPKCTPDMDVILDIPTAKWLPI